MFSLDADVCEALRQGAHTLRIPMSQIVEEGIRLRLAMPAPAAEQDDEEGEALRRSDRETLIAITALGPGWHLCRDIAAKGHLGLQVARRSLGALERAGKVFRWGDAPVLSSGAPGGGCWGTRPAMDSIRLLLAAVVAEGTEGLDRSLAKLKLVRKLAEGMSDVAEVRKALEPLGLSHKGLDVWNFAELAERRQRALDVQERADKARYEKELAERRQREKEHDAEQKRLDREYRGITEPDEEDSE